MKKISWMMAAIRVIFFSMGCLLVAVFSVQEMAKILAITITMACVFYMWICVEVEFSELLSKEFGVRQEFK